MRSLLLAALLCAPASAAPLKLEKQWTGGRCLTIPPASDSWMIRDQNKLNWVWSMFGRQNAPEVDFSTHFAVAVALNGPEGVGFSLSWPGVDNSNGGYLVHYRVAPARNGTRAAPCPYAIRLYSARDAGQLKPLQIQIVRDR